MAAVTLLMHAPCGAGRGVPPAAAAVEAQGLCFRVVGDELLVMLPEALGFFSELLEDPEGRLERAAWAIFKDLEEISGGKLGVFM